MHRICPHPRAQALIRSIHTTIAAAFERLFKPRYVKLIVHVDLLPQMGQIGEHVAHRFAEYRGLGMPRMVVEPGTPQDRSLHTTPGTLADELGCLAALTVLAAVAYILLVLA